MGESEGAVRRGCAAQSGKIRFGAQVEAAGIFFNRRKETFHWERWESRNDGYRRYLWVAMEGGSPWTLSVWNLSSLVSLGYRTSMELEKARTKEE